MEVGFIHLWSLLSCLMLRRAVLWWPGILAFHRRSSSGRRTARSRREMWLKGNQGCGDESWFSTCVGGQFGVIFKDKVLDAELHVWADFLHQTLSGPELGEQSLKLCTVAIDDHQDTTALVN